MIDTFKAALETVGGTFKLAHDYTDAMRMILEICRVEKAKTVVVARGVLTARLPIDILRENGLQVKSTSEITQQDALSIVEAADLGVTDASLGVAETGTVAVVTGSEADRLVSALPRAHVALLERKSLISSFGDFASSASELLHSEGVTSLSLITGTSGTSDIEETLVRGVHGPHALYVIIVGE